MDTMITILLVVAAVKSVIMGVIVYKVFRTDIQTWWRSRKTKETSAVPVCVYCQSRWTQQVDQSDPRWDNDDLVVTSTYECQHCHLPFWRVERIPVGKVAR